MIDKSKRTLIIKGRRKEGREGEKRRRAQPPLRHDKVITVTAEPTVIKTVSC